MNPMIQAVMLGILRTFSASAGGWLVAHGVMQANQQDSLTGSVLFLVPLLLSVVDKFVVKHKVLVAHTTSPTTPLPPNLR